MKISRPNKIATGRATLIPLSLTPPHKGDGSKTRPRDADPTFFSFLFFPFLTHPQGRR